jgi:hypothetical protein
MLAASHTSGFGAQVAIIVIAAFIVGTVGWLAKRWLKRAADKEASRTKDMQEVKSTLGELRSALITDAPTPFNPFPQKKLVDRFNELWASHFELKRTVDRLDAHVSGIKTDTSALVKDSETNKGSTMRDSVDRIEAEQERLRTEKREGH